jgi:hypothetical protein
MQKALVVLGIVDPDPRDRHSGDRVDGARHHHRLDGAAADCIAGPPVSNLARRTARDGIL